MLTLVVFYQLIKDQRLFQIQPLMKLVLCMEELFLLRNQILRYQIVISLTIMQFKGVHYLHFILRFLR